jgi:plastocyanin
MKQPRRILVFALPVLLALIAAGCGGSSSSSTSADTSESGAANTGTVSTTPAAGGQTVKLSADASGALKFDTSSLNAKAGQVTIQMSNPSSIEHGISIEGNGVDAEGSVVPQGGTATVSANLKPGTYTFYCPVDSHRQQGMQGTLTVK